MKQSWKWAAVAAVAGSLALAQPKKVSPKEGEALMAIQNATTPEARLQAVENLLTKFADTEYKVIALEIATDSVQQKAASTPEERERIYEQTVIYAERLLQADPKNLNGISALAKVISGGIRENDLDKEDKLKRVDELAGPCLKMAEAKNPSKLVPDEQWAARRNEYLADCHDAVAAASIVRKKNDLALTEYEASLGLRKDPATMVRIAQIYNAKGKYDDSIALLEKVQAIPDVNPVVKQVASNERVKAIMAKQKAKSQADVPIPQKQ